MGSGVVHYLKKGNMCRVSGLNNKILQDPKHG